MANPEKRQDLAAGGGELTRRIRRTTLVGMFANVALAALKVGVGLFAHSQALVADGVHSLSDLATDLAVLIGAPLWAAPPDRDHPYGHGRVETLINLGIGLVLAGTAVTIAWRALVSLTQGAGPAPGWAALAAALASIAAKETVYRYTAARARHLRSSALASNAWHHRSDALSSVPVALAVVGARLLPHWTFLDEVAALLVTAMLLKATWHIAWPGLHELLEARGCKACEHDIVTLADEFDHVREVHSVRSRRVGGAVFADLHLLVSPTMTVEAAHEIAESFKRAVIERQEDVVDVLVHVEPWSDEERHTRGRSPTP